MGEYTDIAWLRYELELLRKRVAEKDEVIAEAGEMLAMRDRQVGALKEENAGLKCYAERYRWLRRRLSPKDISIIRMRNDLYPELDYEVDTATDAAMAKGEHG